MKKIFRVMLLMVMTGFLILSNQTFAQKADTLLIAANPPGNINNVIMGDTTATGQRNNPNRVYLLQQTSAVDTPYYFTATMYVNFNLTLIGKRNPITGNLPVIGRFILSDNSSPNNYFINTGNLTLKNLYFLGLRNDESIHIYSIEHATADSVVTIADNCVFDFMGSVFDLYGNADKVFVTNCEFRNNCERNYNGTSGITAENGVTIDTAELINDSWYCWGQDIIKAYSNVGYLLIDHNTCMFNSGMGLECSQATNAVIKNNIFYDLGVHGCDSSEMQAGTFNVFNGPMGLIRFDTLSTLLNAPYNFTEADRKVTVENNVYYWPDSSYGYWRTATDTAQNHPGYLTPPQFMSPSVAQMFANKTKWPGFVYSNNDSLDPGFDTAWVNSETNALIAFCNVVWTQGKAQYLWSPLMDTPANYFPTVPQNWASKQGYPVPENLAYTNTALIHAGTDGKALGDLNWFPDQLTAIKQTPKIIPASFVLNQNYPNPFNPSTKITYSVAQTGYISLNVYNVLGQKVATLFSGIQKAGQHITTFDGANLSSGVYFYTLKGDGFSSVKKMVLLK
jgi:Secretion system C-terminal sorting domain/Right handed beta helix region